MARTTEIAGGVACLNIKGFVNVYFLGRPGEAWTLVDAGVGDASAAIQAAADERFGPGARPEAIVLTHGHFDHVGAAISLADAWNVPIYVHPLERPYLSGQSAYPPMDATVGGAAAVLSRFCPENSSNLGSRLRDLPENGALSFLPEGWEWLWTPGHAPGHVSFYRPADRTLIAGDALATVNMDSALALAINKQEVCPAFAPVIYDWGKARASAQELAALKPLAVACGHGKPMVWPDVPDALTQFANNFPVPAHGRYVPVPAVTGEAGIVSVPPPEPDPLPQQLAIAAGIAAVAALGITLFRRRNSS